MKTKIERTEIVTKYQQTIVTCDLCGVDIGSTQRAGSYDEVTMSARIGNVWPEGDFRTGYVLDLCGSCFMSKVKPAVDAIVKFREFDSEEGEQTAIDEPLP